MLVLLVPALACAGSDRGIVNPGELDGASISPGTITTNALDASVNASLALADTALQLTYSTPATNSAAGTAGTFSYDLNYLYVCVSNATWRRVALPTW